MTLTWDYVTFLKFAVTRSGIDILVSNAAANPHMGSILDCDEGSWDKIFDINVKSALMLTKLCVPHMIERDGGAIVYVTSIAGRF